MIIMVGKELVPLLTFAFMIMFLFMQISLALNITPNPAGLIAASTGVTHNEKLYLSEFLTLQGNLQR